MGVRVGGGGEAEMTGWGIAERGMRGYSEAQKQTIASLTARAGDCGRLRLSVFLVAESALDRWAARREDCRGGKTRVLLLAT